MARINNIYKYKKKELNPESILLGSMSPNGETVNYNIVDIALFVADYIGDVEAGIQSIVEGEGISIDNTDPKNPIISALGGDLTLEQARQNGNVLEGAVGLYNSDEDVINEKIDYDPIRNSWGINSDEGLSWVFPSGFASYHDGYTTTFDSGGSVLFNITSNNPDFRGIVGNTYFGANYTDNTYIQKKYVDDNFLPLPTEGTSGQVLTTNGGGDYTWEDVVDWSNLTDKKHLRYDSSLGKPVDSNTSDTTTGISVDGDVRGKGFIGKSVSANVASSYLIDLNDIAEHYILTMTDNTSISFSNMISNAESVVISLTVTGSFSMVLPSFLKASPDNDSYEGTMYNEIVINIKRGGGTPLGYYTLKNYEI